MRLVGIDPGARGALALLVDGQLQDVADMPVVEIRRGKTDKAEVEGYKLAKLLRDWRPDVVVIEQVGGMSGQSASAAFNFGRACGAAEYTVTALGLRIAKVAPVTWKKALGVKSNQDNKDPSRLEAMRLWPALADKFSRKKDADRAEAALIARWFSVKNPGGGVFD